MELYDRGTGKKLDRGFYNNRYLCGCDPRRSNEKERHFRSGIEVPFPVQAEEESGVYTVKGGQTGTGKVKVGSDGAVVIKGLKMGDYRVTETKAPEGYNKLTESFLVSAEKIRATRTDASTYLDETEMLQKARLRQR